MGPAPGRCLFSPSSTGWPLPHTSLQLPPRRFNACWRWTQPRRYPTEATAGEQPGDLIPQEISYGTLLFEPHQGVEDSQRVCVRFSVGFRCHSRQMLCVGGSQYPFGWSFVSIAKAPMTWNPKDIWTAEVELPAGLCLEYKYVILEEQVWTKQEDDESEGLVELSYRSSEEPFQPPDVKTIRKQMAIVDWQPGPNRSLEVPTVEELAQLRPGDTVKRTPARPRPHFTFKQLDDFTDQGGGSHSGTWEKLSIREDGFPVLTRRDEWAHKGSGLGFDSRRWLFLGD